MRRKQPPHNKVCEYCGKKYQALRSDSKVCSTSCRTAIFSQRAAINKTIPIVRAQVIAQMREELAYYTCDSCFHICKENDSVIVSNTDVIRHYKKIEKLSRITGVRICKNCAKDAANNGITTEMLAERIAMNRADLHKCLYKR